jgi:50S ribosomal protein L24
VSKEGSIHVSNVALLVNGERTKVGFELRDGKKVRVAKKSGKVID